MGLRILHHFRALTLGMLTTLVVALSSVFKTRAALQLENLALRHQLGVLRRSVKKPKLTPLDRLLWAWLCGVWADWRCALIVVKPETRDRLAPERLSPFLDLEGPTWPARASVGSERRTRSDPSDEPSEPNLGSPKDSRRTAQTRYEHRRDLREQVPGPSPEAAIADLADFLGESREEPGIGGLLHCSDPLRFQVLYVFLVLAHDRRRILHFGVTAHRRMDRPTTPRRLPLGHLATLSSTGSR